MVTIWEFKLVTNRSCGLTEQTDIGPDIWPRDYLSNAHSHNTYILNKWCWLLTVCVGYWLLTYWLLTYAVGSMNGTIPSNITGDQSWIKKHLLKFPKQSQFQYLQDSIHLQKKFFYYHTIAIDSNQKRLIKSNLFI